jgi:formylglycine-generating enzyme required for sulfatase activity
MGDAFGEGLADELPVHNVCISAFEMDVHEVTNAEYAECVRWGGCTPPGPTASSTRDPYFGNPAYGDFPMIMVSWEEASNFCTWAGKRLPTEAEWEYAARGRLVGKRYPSGDSISASDANYDFSGGLGDTDTSQVESYAPNGYGLYDMAGNVAEYVADWYISNYYSWSLTNDPSGPPGPDYAVGGYRVTRGGSHYSQAWGLRVSNRGSCDQRFSGAEWLGFRCAR